MVYALRATSFGLPIKKVQADEICLPLAFIVNGHRLRKSLFQQIIVERHLYTLNVRHSAIALGPYVSLRYHTSAHT